MARPTKLTEQQKADIKDEKLRGATIAILAKKYKVSIGTVSGVVSEIVPEMEKAAKTLAKAKVGLDRFNVFEKASITRFADDLVETSHNMANSAKNMSRVTSRLAEIAYETLCLIDGDPKAEDIPKKFEILSNSITGANKASIIPLGLINANKELTPKQPPPDPEETVIPDDPVAASREYQRMIKGG